MPKPEDDDLGALVELTRRGDLSAYGRLIERTQSTVRAVARHLVKSDEEARDLAQETYLTAYRKLDTLARAQSVRAWLKRIVTNLALSELRRRRVAFVELDEEHPESLHVGPESERSASQEPLERALLTLSVTERRLCERFYRGAWSTGQLARAEGISEVALRKRLSRLRARLKEEIIMNTRLEETTDGPPHGLSSTIVELLAHPTLTELPENPVGALWSTLRASLPDYDEVELPERISLSDVEAIVGADRMPHDHYTHHELPDERILRSDTSMPMMIHLARDPRPCRLTATGKVYRNDAVDHRHLQAFHQAEVLHVGADASEWRVAEWLTTQATRLLHGRKLRIEQIDFPFMCSRAYDLKVEVDGEWVEVAAFGRFHDDIAERLGGVGQRAVGAGLGLERWAQLAYGIDDIRKVATATVPRTG